MGKSNKKPADIPAAAPGAAAAQQPAQNEQPAVPVAKFINEYQGMHPDSIVTALERIGKMSYDDPKAAEHLNITPEHRQYLNELVLAGMTTMVVVEIAARKSVFALTMSETQFDIVKKVAAEIGAPIIANYLPTTVVAENGEKQVEVKLDENTVQVSKETKSRIEEEEALANSTVNIDPTKFKSEQDLAKALKYILTSEKAVFLKFSRSCDLLRSYRLIQAGNDEDKKAEINAKAYGDLLAEVFQLVGRLPLILTGFGGFLYRETSQILNPVLAFCKLRDASKNSTGEPSVSDAELVGIMRSLIEYQVDDRLREADEAEARAKKDIETLSKDKKANTKAIEDVQNRLDSIETSRKHYHDVLDCVHNPSGEFADSFLEDYANNESENYKNARKAFAYISSSFYGNDESKAANQEALRRNVQQHIGIITNLFRSPSEQLNYSFANLVEIGASASAEGSKN